MGHLIRITARLTTRPLLNRTDTIRLRSAKIRDFAVEPFAARWTYTHRADSAELETARFFGANVAETGGKSSSGDAAVREAVVEALADGPLNKKQVIATMRAELPDVAAFRIRSLLDRMVGVELKMTVKARGANVLELL